jgi:hypothetical protein
MNIITLPRREIGLINQWPLTVRCAQRKRLAEWGGRGAGHPAAAVPGPARLPGAQAAATEGPGEDHRLLCYGCAELFRRASRGTRPIWSVWALISLAWWAPRPQGAGPHPLSDRTEEMARLGNMVMPPAPALALSDSLGDSDISGLCHPHQASPNPLFLHCTEHLFLRTKMNN